MPIHIQTNVNPDFKYLTTLFLAIRTSGLLFQIGTRTQSQEQQYCRPCDIFFKFLIAV